MEEYKLTTRKEKKPLVTFKPVQIWTETHDIVASLAEETGLNKDEYKGV